MKDNYMSIGFILIILNTIMVQFISLFPNYVFLRIGINIDNLWLSLHIFPFSASLIATIYAKRFKLLISLFFGFFAIGMTILGNFISNRFREQSDFEGLYGAIDMFQISFFINIPIALLASLIGFVLIPNSHTQND